MLLRLPGSLPQRLLDSYAPKSPLVLRKLWSILTRKSLMEVPKDNP